MLTYSILKFSKHISKFLICLSCPIDIRRTNPTKQLTVGLAHKRMLFSAFSIWKRREREDNVMEITNTNEVESVGNHLLSYPQLQMRKQKSSSRALQVQEITTEIFCWGADQCFLLSCNISPKTTKHYLIPWSSFPYLTSGEEEAPLWSKGPIVGLGFPPRFVGSKAHGIVCKQ